MTERHLKVINGEGIREEEPKIETWVDGKKVWLTRKNTIKRIFKAGNGIYDHWVYRTSQDCAQVKAFWPNPELLKQLNAMGCITQCDEEPDGYVMDAVGTYFSSGLSALSVQKTLNLVKSDQFDTNPPPPDAA